MMDPRTFSTDRWATEVDREEREEPAEDHSMLVGTSEDEPVITRGYD